MDTDRLQSWQQIYDDAGAPGVQAFGFAVRRPSLQTSDAEAKAFVDGQSASQIMQGNIPSDGVVASDGKDNSRAQADLIDFSKRIKRINKGYKYVLVVFDLYERQLSTVPMKSKSSEETIRTWRSVLEEALLQKLRLTTARNGHY